MIVLKEMAWITMEFCITELCSFHLNMTTPTPAAIAEIAASGMHRTLYPYTATEIKNNTAKHSPPFFMMRS